jgi:hypothetical protein
METEIKRRLKAVKNYKSISMPKLKEEDKELYKIVFSNER